MKKLKLTPTQMREWRMNVPVLVADDGITVLRALSPVEIDTFARLETLVKHTREGQAYIENEGTPDEKQVVIELAQVNATMLAMRRHVNGKEVIDHRERFKKEVFQKFGACQLTNFTGKYLASVRDQSAIPNIGSVAGVPHPSACQCREWAGPDGLSHAGRHHKICSWNEKAPLEERALDGGGIISNVKSVPEGTPNVAPKKLEPPKPVGIFRKLTAKSTLAPSAVTARLTMPVAGAARASGSPVATVNPLAAVVGTNPTSLVVVAPPARVGPLTPENATDAEVPKPEECVCKGYARTTGSEDGHHHPICQWEERWKMIAPPADVGAAVSDMPYERKYLVDLETREAPRAATAEEIAEASGESGFCTINGRQYGVVPESEMKQEHTIAQVVAPV